MYGKPLIEIDDVLLRHCTTATVVTANERLQRAVRDAYDQLHPTLRTQSAPNARIATLDAYLRERFETLRCGRTFLTADAQRLAWLECSPQAPDLDADSHYDRIAEAWHLIHDWELGGTLVQFNDNENHRLFHSWAEAYRRNADLNRWATQAELPAIIATAVQRREIPAQTLLLVGFDVVTPSLKRLIDAFQNAGESVRQHSTERPHADNIRAISTADPQQELRAAVHWAREILRDSPESTSIGIAVPDLVGSYDRITRELDAILRPDDIECEHATSPYNVSGGIALSSVPVVADALEFIDWLFEPIRYTRAAQILRSPFLSLGAPPSNASDASLPESYDAALFATHTSATPLRDIVGRSSCIGLVDLKTAIIELRDILMMAGWPNTACLTGESFQAQQAFLALFDELAAHSGIIQPRNMAAMARRIRRAAEHRLFAPQRPRAALHVLGYLETAGLEFTHLWVTGLNQADWPANAEPNPFIPLRLLRKAGVTRSDNDGEITFARHMTQHWRHAARSVVFSYAQVRDEVAHRLSPLVGVVPDETSTADHPLHPAHPYFVKQTALVARDEPPLRSLRVAELRHRGTGILRDQSACPFRAFARYRLYAASPTPPHSYPNATERGVAIHAALRGTFERLRPDLDGVQSDGDSLHEILDHAVATAIETTYRRVPAEFRWSERKRLIALLREWLQVELERPRFYVVANERATTLSLGGIEFNLRIDRIDRVDVSGELMVIDYKTGATSTHVVFGDRPEEPQLPMYALSEPSVAAIAFAQVRRGQCRLTGWSEESAAQSAHVRLDRPPTEYAARWKNLRQAWETTLTRLAREFHSGIADVDPRDAKACRECNLHALCRIREIQQIDN